MLEALLVLGGLAGLAGGAYAWIRRRVNAQMAFQFPSPSAPVKRQSEPFTAPIVPGGLIVDPNAAVPFSRLPAGPPPPPRGTVEEKTQRMARAIATAEGYGPPQNLATRANNPGDLKRGDVGLGTIHDKTVFATPAEGWAALYRQIDLMRTGQSAYYNASMTFSQIARVYTGGDNSDAWAATVTRELGITPQTTLAAYFAG